MGKLESNYANDLGKMPKFLGKMLDKFSTFVGPRYRIVDYDIVRPRPRAVVLLFKLTLYESCI